MDLVLNNLQMLICHKIQTSKYQMLHALHVHTLYTHIHIDIWRNPRGVVANILNKDTKVSEFKL